MFMNGAFDFTCDDSQINTATRQKVTILMRVTFDQFGEEFIGLLVLTLDLHHAENIY